MKTSHATGDQTQGVGAAHHCDLSPRGTLEETIREWKPDEKLVIGIDSATKLPIKRGLTTFDSAADDAATTTVGVNYDYETKWGVVTIGARGPQRR